MLVPGLVQLVLQSARGLARRLGQRASTALLRLGLSGLRAGGGFLGHIRGGKIGRVRRSDRLLAAPLARSKSTVVSHLHAHS